MRLDRIPLDYGSVEPGGVAAKGECLGARVEGKDRVIGGADLVSEDPINQIARAAEPPTVSSPCCSARNVLLRCRSGGGHGSSESYAHDTDTSAGSRWLTSRTVTTLLVDEKKSK